jgi:hypothetical protein
MLAEHVLPRARVRSLSERSSQPLGADEGPADGTRLGILVGPADGLPDGLSDGFSERVTEGPVEGTAVDGAGVGPVDVAFLVGATVITGISVGEPSALAGAFVGDSVLEGIEEAQNLGSIPLP